MARMTQRDRVIQYIKDFGSITRAEAFNELVESLNWLRGSVNWNEWDISSKRKQCIVKTDMVK